VPFTIENLFLGVIGETPSSGDMQMFLLIGGGVAAVASLLVCYFGSGLGAKSQVKQAAKLAAKGK
jgi:hypothetical protein